MKKLRYILTIYDRNTKTVQHLERDAETINATVTKELGDWGHCTSTSNVDRSARPKEFFQAGTTKDNTKCFSILCIEENIDEDLKNECELNSFENQSLE